MKNFLKSKTIWVNVLTFVAGAITFVQDHDLFVENPDVVALLAGALAVVNVGLRFITGEPVSVGPAPKPEAE